MNKFNPSYGTNIEWEMFDNFFIVKEAAQAQEEKNLNTVPTPSKVIN